MLKCHQYKSSITGKLGLYIHVHVVMYKLIAWTVGVVSLNPTIQPKKKGHYCAWFTLCSNEGHLLPLLIIGIADYFNALTLLAHEIILIDTQVHNTNKPFLF